MREADVVDEEEVELDDVAVVELVDETVAPEVTVDGDIPEISLPPDLFFVFFFSTGVVGRLPGTPDLIFGAGVLETLPATPAIRVGFGRY